MMKGSQQHPTRPADDLRRASINLAYEIDMLTGIVRVLLQERVAPPRSERDTVVHNALIHAFLMFIRNLHAFLYMKGQKPDDLVALDFFDEDSQWTTRRPLDPIRCNGSRLREMINYRVAHLSWKRLETVPPEWPFLEMAHALSQSILSFRRLVDESRIDDAFKKSVSEMDKFLARFSETDRE